MWVLGLPTRFLQYLAWCFSAGVAAVSGILTVLVIRYASASFFHWTTSGEAVIWAVLGGTNTVWGALAGTAALMYAKDALSSQFAYYPIIIGTILILVVRFRFGGLLRIAVGPLANSSRWRYVRFPPTDDVQPHDLSLERHTPAIVVEGARKSFAGTTAINDCSLHLTTAFFKLRLSNGDMATILPRGRPFPAMALIGPNGAGKTTLLNLLNGFHDLDGGSVTTGGAMVRLPEPRPVLGRSFQNPQLFEELSVGENLLIGSMRSFRLSRYVQRASSTPTLHAQVHAVARRLELERDLNRIVSKLSYGRRKVVDIGVALASGPGMLLLDEPTAGVSPRELSLIIDVILELAETLPVVLVEHNLAVVRQLRFDVAFMAEGRFVATGEAEEVLAQPEVRQLFTGERLSATSS
jgi:ABC-type branched-subunit amino acid transport system ATPase component